jgi:AFG3 family protein
MASSGRRTRPGGSTDAHLTAIQWEDYQKSQNPNLNFAPSNASQLSSQNLVHELNDLMDTFLSKIPKGFENFFPKNGSGPSPKKKPEKKTHTETKNTTFKTKDEEQKQRNNNRGSIPPPEENDPQNIPAMIALLLMIMAARRYVNDGDETGKNGKEITFVEFRNHLLESGQIEKIEVVNNKMARVVLRPGSKGIPTSTFGSSREKLMSSDWNSSTMGADDASNADGQDTTILEFSNNDSSVMQGDSRTSTSSASQTPSYHFYIGSIESFEEKLSKAQSHIHPREWIPVQYVNEVNMLVELVKATPMLVMLAMIYYYSRGMMGGAGASGGGAGGMGGMFQVGKSNAKKINPETVGVNFNDVAGCQQAKREIMEFVDFLKDSSPFTKLGAKIPKGALLCGPPGTGKTLLAKAVAGEAGVPFFSISGSDFIEMFVGVGPSRVRDLFKEARASAPCIIFIDEIDAVGRQRGRGGFSGGNDERENTLNQLLVEMDGFNPSTGVVVLAGTNRVDILDQALTRPGRFDRQITVDKPDLQGRKEIFNVHLEGIKLEGDKEDFSGRLAGLTPGFAGADIANLCNEAAIVAARRKGESVLVEDFEKATDRIIGGLESNKIMSDEERQIVAHHEAGHAVAGWFLEHADPLLKVTIIPRTSGALGFAQYLPKETFLRTQDQIMDIVCMALAGRAAEEVFFGKVTTGASDDLRRVTQLVYSTIHTYGMNSKVGQLAYPQDQDTMGDKPYSDATAEAMDDEARAIVDAAYERTLELMIEKKEQVEQVAKLLIEKETITHDDMIDLIGERPFKGDDQYQEYVSARAQPAAKKEDETKESESSEEDAKIEDSQGGLTPGLA